MVANAYMNNHSLGQTIKQVATTLHEDNLGFWKFDYAAVTIFVITDESHNRMRIMSPVADANALDKDALHTLMSANLQFLNALDQVTNLSKNYGTSYSSGELVFNG